MARTFHGQRIKDQTVSLGTGGEIKRGEDFPDIPDRSLVTFQAQAKFETLKYKALEKGGWKETMILTVVADTFEVVDIEAMPQQDELPMETPGDIPGPDDEGDDA